jgi:hypothetical protein
MEAFDEVNTFSFLTSLPQEQEEFLKQIKEVSNLEDAGAAASDAAFADNLESVFSFTPLLGATHPSSNQSTASNPSSEMESETHDTDSENSVSSPIPDHICQQNTPSISLTPNNPRAWKVIHMSPLLMTTSGNDSLQMTVAQIAESIKIELRTRSEASTNVLAVPERMYSSLKYEMKQAVAKGVIADSSNVLMSKLEVVDPQDHFEEILKTNGQKLIKGVSEVTAMSRNANGCTLECKMKIQFTDVSYHHEKKYFAFKVSFFDPSFSMEEPVLMVLSAPFQVFARRPTARKSSTKESTKKTTKEKQQETGKKRKQSEKDVEPAAQQAPQQPPAKKIKITAAPREEPKQSATAVKEEKLQLKKSATLQDFIKCLDLLVAFKNSLSSEEQRAAVELVQKRIGYGSSLPPYLSKVPATSFNAFKNTNTKTPSVSTYPTTTYPSNTVDMDLSSLFSDM